MNKELRALLDQINAKKAEVKNLVGENKVEEAKASKDELKKLQDKFDILYDMYEEEGAENTENAKNKAKENNKKDSIKEFANAARNGFNIRNEMSSGSLTDGGYTIPEDIETRINEYREAKRSLKDLVTVIPVKTNKGARTYKTRTQQTGFTKVGEKAKIGKKGTPQFERIAYEIEKYAGYFPVTNELLEDSDAGIADTLIKWIGDESRVTANKLIVEAINTKAKVALNGLDDIKKALNVTIGSAFKSTSKVVTNDDGLHYLDTLKDADGKYLLQPDPVTPMVMWLCVGATKIPVEVYPNEDLETVGNKVPMILGDLEEGIIFWDRKLMNIKTSDTAVIGELNAYEEDLTLYRAIEREDVTTKDTKAYVNGYIDITPQA